MERNGFLAKLPRLGKCCWCFDLRSGVIVLGVLGILGCVFNLVGLILVNKEGLRQKFVRMGYEGSESGTYATAEIMTSIFSLICSTILVLLLLIGAIQRKVLLLKIYVVFNMICIGIIGVLTVVVFMYVPLAGIILVIYLAIVLYYLFCVNSYLQELIDEQHGVAPNSTTFKPA